MRMNPSTVRRVKVGFALALLFANIPASITALDWPADPARPVAGFGSPREGYLLAQIILGGEPSLLHAAEEGEILFVAEEGATPGGFPFPAGGIVALAHPNGFITVYTGIAPRTSFAAGKLAKGEAIGVWNRGGALGYLGPGFAVSDRTLLSWVNPLMLLSPLDSDRAPDILDLALAGKGATTVIQEGKKGVTLAQGSYDLYVRVGEGRKTEVLSAPFKLKVSLNGIDSAERTFDSAASKDMGLAFTGSAAPSGNGIDGEGRFFLGRVFLAKGSMRIRIRAESISGIVTEEAWSLDIR